MFLPKQDTRELSTKSDKTTSIWPEWQINPVTYQRHILQCIRKLQQMIRLYWLVRLLKHFWPRLTCINTYIHRLRFKVRHHKAIIKSPNKNPINKKYLQLLKSLCPELIFHIFYPNLSCFTTAWVTIFAEIYWITFKSFSRSHLTTPNI